MHLTLNLFAQNPFKFLVKLKMLFFTLFFLSSYAQRSDCSIVIEAYKSMGGVTNLDPFSFDTTNCCYNTETEEGINGVSCQNENVTIILWDEEALSGHIPSILGELYSLFIMRLDRNYLTGTIPSSLGRLRNLKFLFLNDNSLSGTIPSSFTNLINLSRA
jgi:hypothetical protein